MHEAAITWLDGGHIEHAPASAFRKELDVTANAENGLDIKMLFPYEGEYRIRIEGENADGDKKSFTFCVYAVSGDLVGMYPFIGDLHMHTNFPTERMTPRMLPQPIVPAAMIFLP